MKVCPECGEVFGKDALRCSAHDTAGVDWAGLAETYTDSHTAVDHQALDADTPFEVNAIAGEIDVLTDRQPPARRKGAAPSAGVPLARRYRLTRQIGVGGFGAVFAAQDELRGVRVAVKLLSPAASQDRELLTRFYREAIAANRAEHPNVVEVLDVGEDSGTHYIVMEYLDGCSLYDVLGATKALPPGRALAVAAQCASGLAAAHGAGILHRDLKPSNVFLVEDEVGGEFVKVIDFGISKLTRAAGYFTDLTSASKVVGTPCYISPEQATGRELDGRCDVYGLAVILFEMLTGTRPFTGGSTIEILNEHLYAPRLPPSAVRPELTAHPAIDELVVTALARSREDRYASMDEFRDAILDCLRAVDPARAADLVDREAVATDHRLHRLATVPTARQEAGPIRQRRWALVGGAVMASAILLAVAWWPSSPATERATTTAAPATTAAEPPAPEEPRRPRAADDHAARAHTAPAADAAVPHATEAPGPRMVRVTSAPPRAAVFEGGRRLGVTPLDIDIEAGDRRLSVRAPGRRPRVVTVGKNDTEIHVALVRRRTRKRARRPPATAERETTRGIKEW